MDETDDNNGESSGQGGIATFAAFRYEPSERVYLNRTDVDRKTTARTLFGTNGHGTEFLDGDLAPVIGTIERWIDGRRKARPGDDAPIATFSIDTETGSIKGVSVNDEYLSDRHPAHKAAESVRQALVSQYGEDESDDWMEAAIAAYTCPHRPLTRNLDWDPVDGDARIEVNDEAVFLTAECPECGVEFERTFSQRSVHPASPEIEDAMEEVKRVDEEAAEMGDPTKVRRGPDV